MLFIARNFDSASSVILLVLPCSLQSHHLLRSHLHAKRLHDAIALVLRGQLDLSISQMARNELPEAVEVLQTLRLVGPEVPHRAHLICKVLVHDVYV